MDSGATPESEAVEISSNFPDFRTFTQKVLKECPEYNYQYVDEKHPGEPEGFKGIVTSEQFISLFDTFSSNYIGQQAIAQPYLLQKAIDNESIICPIGDIHGSVHSLIRNIWTLIARGHLDENLCITNPSFYLIFLGDFIDGGRYNLLTLALLLKLSNNNPDNVFLVRGNHEQEFQDGDRLASNLTIEINKTDQRVNIETYCQIIFSILPVEIFFTLEGRGHIRCCHGGGFFSLTKLLDGEKHVNEWLSGDEAILPLSKLAESISTDRRIHKKKVSQEKIYTFLLNRILWGDFNSDNSEIADRSGGFGTIAYSQAKEIIETAYSKDNPKLRPLAIFRGHQDSGSDLKFLVQKLDGSDDSYDGLLAAPQCLRWFKINDSLHLPIFTLSTASEGKSLPATSCIILNTAPPYEEWQAERVITVLGNTREPVYPNRFRHYSRIIEGIYSLMAVHLETPLGETPIRVAWHDCPYKKPLIILQRPTTSPVPELTPVPELLPSPVAE